MKRTYGISMKKSIPQKNRKPLNSFRLYFRYIRLQFLSGIQYKGWWMMIPQVFLVVITDPIGSICMFARFGSIGEWSMERILLIYSMAITAFGLAETFCRGFDSFPHKMVQNGEFDRVLLRPRSTVVQVMGSVFHIHRAARVISGCIAVAWCLWKLQIPMTPLKILFLLYRPLWGDAPVYGRFYMDFWDLLFFHQGAGMDLYFYKRRVSGDPLPYALYASAPEKHIYFSHSHPGRELLSCFRALRMGGTYLERAPFAACRNWFSEHFPSDVAVGSPALPRRRKLIRFFVNLRKAVFLYILYERKHGKGGYYVQADFI